MTIKRTFYGMALFLGWMLVLSGTVPAQSGMIGGQMGQPEQATEPTSGGMIGQGGMGMMGPQMMQPRMRGMPGMLEGMTLARPGQMARLLKWELGLSDEQTKRLRELFFQAMKARIEQQANLRIAELESRELLEAKPVDMGKIEAKLKAIEELRTALRFNLIKAHEQAKAVLTPEQRQQLERLHDRLPGMMGPAMMGMMEMMDEGDIGMIGPEMMQQRMRGMTGGGPEGQAQSPAAMAGSPQQLTQTDMQGGVTVTATLLTLDKPRPDGKLAVQIKLDMHSVDLDQYHLDKLATLRNTQGQEMQAVGLESLSGSGHHREGVLLFQATDANGRPVLSPEAKALTLIFRGIGGIAERAFRWQLPPG
jgi:Spy/CpxP family protein refolding chaperone